jgi:prepilin-type N-terminal cleavage/methylation domain-containing protein
MALIHQRSRHQERSLLHSQAHGFSLLELMVSAVVLLIVVGASVNYISLVTQRSKVEQTKVDLAQEGREFVDEFERDVHQSGYPGCAVFNTGANCTAHFNDNTMAVGLVLVSNTQVVFEGDVDGDGVVDSVQYRLVDSAGAFPPAGTCPCTLQRSQQPKAVVAPPVLTAPLRQATTFSQELQNVVNSGVPAAGQVYGNGLSIAGNVLFAGGSTTNDAYYAAVSTFKDFPVFSAFDQNGSPVTLPQDITTVTGQQNLAAIKSIRLTINLLGSGTTGYDIKNGTRPVVTLVGDARRNN